MMSHDSCDAADFSGSPLSERSELRRGDDGEGEDITGHEFHPLKYALSLIHI